MRKSAAAPAFLVVLSLATVAHADEGMWPYNMAPVAEVKEKHGFELSQGFLDNAMRSSVRFNNGGSGSFVSADGLVMTNHHVGSDCIQKLSVGEGAEDVLTKGFYARERGEERRCPDLELNQLVEIEDVTEKVNAAARGKSGEAAQNEAKKAAMGRLEKACAEKSGLRCDVVTLYAGGAYHLYKYKKYTDVRLVFAPEIDVAFFGGDPDNFTYPRWCLDVAFFRVFENDQPARVENHLPFSKEGAQENALVFVSGHPGSTDRFAPVSKLELLRDTVYPFLLEELKQDRDTLKAFMERGPAEERAARDDFFGIENSIKAFTGYLSGLTDEALMREARAREQRLLDEVRKIPDAAERQRLLDAWPRLAESARAYANFYKEYAVTERWLSPASTALSSRARHLLRLGDELPKSSERRLREYRDSNLKSLELSLFSEAPIDPALEVVKLAAALENVRDVFGANHALTRALLAGKTPKARAKEVIEGTRVGDVAFRRQLYQGGKQAVDAARDPLIELVRALDPTARELRRRYENEVEAVETTYSGRIAEAWAKAFGTSIYPDATFTLRINAGVVKGYTEDGERIPWRTQLGGLYVKNQRAGGKEPYRLPQLWLDKVDAVDFTVPYNFVSTNDIIGGNSGSPVIDTKGAVVGLIFDGNLSQLPNRFLYRDETQRAVSVHTAGIFHALERVYEAEPLVQELLEGSER